jgi:tetratricopeptide (TPR) repeat protein
MNDGLLYEYVLDEIEADRPVKSLWAKAIAHSDGNADKVKSVYMQLRVEDIKNEFSILGIDYSFLSIFDLKNNIENLFVDEDWRGVKIQEKKNSEQAIKEEENRKQAQSKLESKDRIEQEYLDKERKKYGRIGGWLWPFGFFLALWALSAVVYPLHTVTIGMDDVKTLLLEGYPKLAQFFEYAFYLALVGQYFVLLLAIFFFNKLKGTKGVAITFFIALIPLNTAASILIFGLLTTDFGQFKGTDILGVQEFGKAVVLPVFTLILSILSIWYFAKSKRVEKTFIRPKDQISPIITAAVLPIILLFAYHQQVPNTADLVDVILDKADQEFALEEYDNANLLYLKATKFEYDKFNDVANKFFEKDMHRTAAEWYQKAVDKGDTDSEFRLAYSYNEIGSYDKAIQYYISSNTRSRWSGAMNNLARVYMVGKKDYKKAAEWAKKAYESDPDYGAFVVAYSYDKLGKHIESADWYEKAIASNPDGAVAYWNLGLGYQSEAELGSLGYRQKKAFQLFLKAARLNYFDAFEKVSVWYRSGIGIEKDIEKAKYWKDKAKK